MTTPSERAGLKEAAAVDFDQLERTLEMCERDQGHNPGMISISVERFRSLLETAKRSLAERYALAGEVAGLEGLLRTAAYACSQLVRFAKPSVPPANPAIRYVPQSIVEMAKTAVEEVEKARLPIPQVPPVDWQVRAREAEAKVEELKAQVERITRERDSAFPAEAGLGGSHD